MKNKQDFYMTVLKKNLPKANQIWGTKSSHKFVICCKAASIDDANNKIAMKFGLDKNTFTTAVVLSNYFGE